MVDPKLFMPTRFAPCGARRMLPYDAELEYLESTGTQWIDTGVAINCVTDVIDCRVTVTSVKNYGTAFGVYELIGGGGKFFGVRRNGAQDSWQPLWGAPSHSLYLDTFYDIHYEYGADKCRINETTGTSEANVAYTKPLYIYALNSSNGASLLNNQRLYSFSVKRNGTLIRDLIPVRVGSVGYLYDRVSKRLFGNAGTGDFTLGPDVVPVEYIESSGTQWIDTEFGFDSSTDRVELSISVPNQTSHSNTWMFGRYFSNNTIGISFRNDSVATAVRFYFKATSPATTLDFSSFSSGKHDVRFDSSGILVDGERQYSYSGSQFSSNSELYLFAVNNNGTVSTGLNMSVYSYSHYRNNVLVRNLKPIRVGTDATSWEGAMMDVLTRRIYRNAGTGAFGYGNDLKYPIPAE